MPSSYSSNLRLELQANGENSSTWGTICNDSVFQLLEAGVAGRSAVSIAGSSDTTLTANNGSADQARSMILELSGAVTGNKAVIIPNVSKMYLINCTWTGSFTVTLKCSGGTGVSLTKSAYQIVYHDGSGAGTTYKLFDSAGYVATTGSQTMAGDLTLSSGSLSMTSGTLAAGASGSSTSTMSHKFQITGTEVDTPTLRVSNTGNNWAASSQLRIVNGTAGSSNFNLLDAQTDGGLDTEFKLRADGNGYCDGTWNGGGADYAEYFESLTGLPIPPGTTVALQGKKVKVATTGDKVIGVVRPKTAPLTLLGNTAWNRWTNKYQKDTYGGYILDPQGRKVLNPDFNPNEVYVPREKRPEWVIVGLMGQIPVNDNSIIPNTWINMGSVTPGVTLYFVR